MNRRTLLLGSVCALAACGVTPTPQDVTAAVTAINGLVADIKQMIAGGGLTPDALANANAQLAQLADLATKLTAGNTTVQTAFAQAQTIIQAIGQWLPLVLTVLPLFGAPVHELAAPTPLNISLRAHFAALQAAAGK